MLVPIQTKGAKPPLFFIHGLYGGMPLGTMLAKTLGAEQPVYALYADGMDGRGRPNTTIGEMVESYVAQIDSICPDGPLAIGSMCAGGVVAVEIARKLLAQGRVLAPLILADPPAFPPRLSGGAGHAAMEQQLYEHTRRVLLHDRLCELFLDARNEEQVHLATLAGVTASLCLGRFCPAPFEGKVELILSLRVAVLGLVHAGAWQNYLVRPPAIHILPGNHSALFTVQREEVARLTGFILRYAFEAEGANKASTSATLTSPVPVM